jgi:tRNA U34 2-thiouridine synthase MnmA/TrmU
MTWVDQPVAPGTAALAQVSAHGRPVPCTVHTDRGAVAFSQPQRPIAPGQTVALYDADDPSVVLGAGIAA